MGAIAIGNLFNMEVAKLHQTGRSGPYVDTSQSEIAPIFSLSPTL